MAEQEQHVNHAVIVARRFTGGLPEEDRVVLYRWGEMLLEIRNSSLPMPMKLQRALRATAQAGAGRPVVVHLCRMLHGAGVKSKHRLWDQRGWVARLGLLGISFGVLVFGGQGAGVAALGGAIGIPLWLVLGGGGAVLGALVEELKPKRPIARYSVLDAERVESTDRGADRGN